MPGKNLAEVGGKSLLRLAGESAWACTHTVISTDVHGDEMRRLARESRADLHPRRLEHATDEAGLEPVIDDVLSWWAEREQPEPAAIVLLQPTSPLRTAKHVAEALRLLEELRCDSVVSVTKLHSLHPIFHGRWVGNQEYITAAHGIGRPRSQDLDSLCYENGAVYAFTTKHWERTKNRMGGDMRCFAMHWSEAVEVDSMEDLEAVRRLCR